MDSVFQNLNRFDTEFFHAHCFDARMALGTRLPSIAQPVSQPASQPGPKSKCEMVSIDHRETITISVVALYDKVNDRRLEVPKNRNFAKASAGQGQLL